jgi:hypothetical protein
MARYKDYSCEQTKLIPLSYERQILLYGIIGGQPSAFYHHSGFYIDAAGRDHLGVPPCGDGLHADGSY